MKSLKKCLMMAFVVACMSSFDCIGARDTRTLVELQTERTALIAERDALPRGKKANAEQKKRRKELRTLIASLNGKIKRRS